VTTHVDMPSLGENVTEGVITRWLKHVGDTVEDQEPLLEVATDKVDTEIPAPFAGTIRELLASENDTVAVGDPLAIIAPAGAGSAPPASLPAPATPPQPGTPAAPPTTTELASTVRPSTPDGGRTEKMTRLRQTVARRMLESLRVSAQLTTVVEADVTNLARLRTRVKDAFHERTGTKLSFLPFFAKAALEALTEHPMLNATVNADNTEVTYHTRRNLGIAVDAPRGLMVPVIRDAGELSIEGLARAIADVAERSRTGRISPDELNGGTFTLTNTGSRGALFDTPIINQPQTGILGTGAVVDRLVPHPDGLGGHSFSVRSMLYLSITYDHRIVDGADAARFLTAIKDRLESPDDHAI
jgi:2-oxoglutarate dehydrogenase E2 component (dihydrolipoamide succinyltransferase)